MEILGVIQSSHEAGLEFADLDSVKEAIRVFATGSTRASAETQRIGFGNAGGGIGALLKTTLDSGHEDAFLADLFAGFNRVEESGVYMRSYDYDGIDPFMKTTVDVRKVQTDQGQIVYLLLLNAAYVGDKVSAGLAERLGVDRGLHHDEVIVEIAPVGDRFEFDFDAIVARLSSIGLEIGSGQEISDHMMKAATEEANGAYDSRYWLEANHDGLLVRFGLETYTVCRPFDYDTRQVAWRQDSAVISGSLSRFKDEGKSITPRVRLSVTTPQPPDADRWNPVPILDPVIKQAVHEQSAAIAAAFQ